MAGDRELLAQGHGDPGRRQRRAVVDLVDGGGFGQGFDLAHSGQGLVRRFVVLDAAQVVVDDDGGVGVATADRLGYLLRGFPDQLTTRPF
ncbi:hypothetical protein GCM10029992_13930 [Glycomyces albus]